MGGERSGEEGEVVDVEPADRPRPSSGDHRVHQDRMLRLPEAFEKPPPRSVQGPEGKFDARDSGRESVPSHPFDKTPTCLVLVKRGADP